MRAVKLLPLEDLETKLLQRTRVKCLIGYSVTKFQLFSGILLLLFLSSCDTPVSDTDLSEVDEIVETGPWADFKNSFPEMTLPNKVPLEISAKEMAKLREIKGDELKFIDESSVGMMFRTPQINQYYRYGKMFETDEVVGLVYFGRTEFLERQAPISYTLATFTHQGKLIDKKVVGGREFLGDVILQTTFKNKRTAKANILKPTYKKDPLKHGYIDNPLISTKKTGYKEFKVEKNGKITEMKPFVK
jgi:hypothetical protein